MANRSRIPAIDGLRVVAVVLVVVFHASSKIAPNGSVGVDLFFVISGFVITRLLLQERESRGDISLRSFYRARAVRLWPALIALCVALNFAAAFAPRWLDSFNGLPYALSYTMDFQMAAGHSDVGALLHTWSLSVEEQFYLLWPVLLVWLLGRRRPLMWVAGLAVAPTFLRWFLGGAVAVHRINYAPDTRADQLLIGCLLALAIQRGLRLNLPAWIPAASGALLAAFAFGFVGIPDYWVIGFAVTAVLSAVVIVGCLNREGIGAVLSFGPLAWIGQNLSYGLYLWHVPAVVALRDRGMSGLPLAAAALAAAFVLALASRALVEVPAARYFKQRASSRLRSGEAVVERAGLAAVHAEHL